MAKRLTREELLTSLLNWEQRALTLYDFISQELAPKHGWYFVSSRLGYRAALVHVDVEGYITHYDESIGSEERRRRDVALYDAAKNDQAELDSLLAAFEARNEFFAKQRAAS